MLARRGGGRRCRASYELPGLPGAELHLRVLRRAVHVRDLRGRVLHVRLSAYLHAHDARNLRQLREVKISLATTPIEARNVSFSAFSDRQDLHTTTRLQNQNAASRIAEQCI